MFTSFLASMWMSTSRIRHKPFWCAVPCFTTKQKNPHFLCVHVTISVPCFTTKQKNPHFLCVHVTISVSCFTTKQKTHTSCVYTLPSLCRVLPQNKTPTLPVCTRYHLCVVFYHKTKNPHFLCVHVTISVSCFTTKQNKKDTSCTRYHLCVVFYHKTKNLHFLCVHVTISVSCFTTRQKTRTSCVYTLPSLCRVLPQDKNVNENDC